MRLRVWQGYALVGVLVAAASWLLPWWTSLPPLATKLVCYETLSLGAVVAILGGARWHRPVARLPWALIAAAQLMFFTADVTFYTFQAVLHDTRFPAPVDALYLAHYAPLVAGLLGLLRRRSPGRDRDGLVDALIITVGCALLSWEFLIGPDVRTSGLTLAARLVSVAYPLMDLLVLAVAIRLAIAGGRRRPAYYLLLSGLLALLTGDAAYGLAQLHGSYQLGNPLDAGWLLFYIALGAAALHPSMRSLAEPGGPSRPDRLSRARLVVLAGAALMAPAVLVVQALRGQPIDVPVIAGASALLFVLTLVRMASLAGHVAAQGERVRLLARLRAVIDASPVAIVELDPAGRVQLWNPAAERIYGWRAEEVVGRPHPSAGDAGWPPPPTAAVGGAGEPPARVELRQHRHDGTPIDVEVSTASLLTPDGQPAGMIGVAADISDRKRLAEQLRHQAFHDELTGLANRALFHDRLEHALARANRHGNRLAVLLLDLDGFKTVNDTLGHATGDQLLRLVAGRLADVVRPEDTIARLGGDEFVVLIEDADSPGSPVALAERLLGTLATPVTLAGRSLRVSASAGIITAGPGADAGPLLRDADVAMYRAKRHGPGQYRVFEPGMRASVVDRAELEDDLRHGLERAEFRLRYQPIIDLHSGVVVGTEALLRWQHPTRGLLAPGSFIPLAEETGLLVEIGAWVLRQACRQARSWQATIPGCEQLGVSVNLSAVQLASPSLRAEMIRALVEAGLEARHLTLELTESVLVADIQATAATLTELRAMGVLVAIDDFGTGYSSLGYLRRMPVDILKIDKSFVDDLPGDAQATALTEAVVKLAATLGLVSIAEGIEHAAQLEQLRELGCQFGQGYHLAKPLDQDDLAALLRQQQPASHTPAALELRNA